MGLIINPRGTAGSGKTELARRIMREYGWTDGARRQPGLEPIFRHGRDCPLGYRLRHPLAHRPLAVLGHYERRSGGCDTIGVRDGGLEAVFDLAAEYAGGGHDVLIEGLQLSGEWERSQALARAYSLHVLELATPPEASARNLARRRRAGAQAIDSLARSAVAERDRVAAACERLRRHAFVHRLCFDAALIQVRRLLCLDEHRATTASRRALEALDC